MFVTAVPRRIDVSIDLREQTVAVWEVLKVISKHLGVHHSTERIDYSRWKTFEMVASLLSCGCPSKVTPKSDYAMLRESTKNSRDLSHTVEQDKGQSSCCWYTKAWVTTL